MAYNDITRYCLHEFSLTLDKKFLACVVCSHMIKNEAKNILSCDSDGNINLCH